MLWGARTGLLRRHAGHSCVPSHRPDCQFADIPSPLLLKRLPEAEGGAAERQSRRRLCVPGRQRAPRGEAPDRCLSRHGRGHTDDAAAEKERCGLPSLLVLAYSCSGNYPQELRSCKP